MDLVQTKLTRSEWNAIEVSVPPHEMKIIKMIVNGYTNPSIIHNDNLTLSSFLKINTENEAIEFYLYNTYFGKDVDKIIKKYSINIHKMFKKC